MDNQEKQSNLSLWIALVVVTAAVAGSGYFAGRWFSILDQDSLRVGLTNIATLGGVASGLSLAGTAVLSLSGDSIKKLVTKHGHWIRATLFGGYLVMIISAFSAAVGAMFVTWPGIAWVMSYSAVSILAGLIVTSALLSSAFSWHALDRQ